MKYMIIIIIFSISITGCQKRITFTSTMGSGCRGDSETQKIFIIQNNVVHFICFDEKYNCLKDTYYSNVKLKELSNEISFTYSNAIWKFKKYCFNDYWIHVGCCKRYSVKIGIHIFDSEM